MLNFDDILADLRAELQATVPRDPPALLAPLPNSPWVAKALLQKSIRRGETSLAKLAATTLLATAPEAFWRRLGSVAFEDVGLANPKLVLSVSAALSGKLARAKMGGEWAVAHYLVSRLSGSPKCRATDDLLLTLEHHPDFAGDRLRLAEWSDDQLCDLIADTSASIHRRALAMWYAIGTDRRPSRQLAKRHGDPARVFQTMLDSGMSASLVAASEEGFRKIGEVLCPLICLLSTLEGWRSSPAIDDTLPRSSLVQGLPGWTFDLYSREGRRALTAFLSTSAGTARWLRKNVPAALRVEFLGTLVFRVEGGLMRRRLEWEWGRKLRRSVDLECFPGIADASFLIERMSEDLSILQEVRANVLQ